MNRLTIRLVGDIGRLSLDDGGSKVLAPGEVGAIYEVLQRVLYSSAPWASGELTAAAAAGLAEAVFARPLEPVYQVPEKSEDNPGDSIQLASDSDGSMSFEELIAKRRSKRFMGPCTLSQLARVLIGAYAVYEEAVAADGYRISRRPVPSAGGRHPFKLIVASWAVRGLEGGFWEFDSRAHTLRRWKTDRSLHAVVGKICDAGDIPIAPGAVIFPLCDLARTLSRYPAGVSLAWRDAGALALMLHLVATDAGLSSSIIGTSGLLARADLDGPAIQDLGALTLGAVPG